MSKIRRGTPPPPLRLPLTTTKNTPRPFAETNLAFAKGSADIAGERKALPGPKPVEVVSELTIFSAATGGHSGYGEERVEEKDFFKGPLWSNWTKELGVAWWFPAIPSSI